jgi:hypothetical protein
MSIFTVLAVYALIAVPFATIGVTLCVMAGRHDRLIERMREHAHDELPAGEPADVTPLRPAA